MNRSRPRRPRPREMLHPARLEYHRCKLWGYFGTAYLIRAQCRGRGRRRGRGRLRGAVARIFLALSAECDQDLRPIRGTQACRWIPPGAGVERAVIAGNDIAKGGRMLVQSRVNETDPRFGFLEQRLVDPREKPSIQGGNGAGATNGGGTPIDQDLITGYRVRIRGDIGYSTASSRLGGRGYVDRILVRWFRKIIADPAARRAFVVRGLVPDDLGGDGISRDIGFQRGAAAADNIRRCCRKIDVISAIGLAVGRSAVTGCRKNGFAHGPGVLERLIERGY